MGGVPCKSGQLESPQWGSDHNAAIKVRLVTACQSFWIGVRLPTYFQPLLGCWGRLCHLLVQVDENKWMGRWSKAGTKWPHYTQLALSRAGPQFYHMGAPNTNESEHDPAANLSFFFIPIWGSEQKLSLIVKIQLDQNHFNYIHSKTTTCNFPFSLCKTLHKR